MSLNGKKIPASDRFKNSSSTRVVNACVVVYAYNVYKHLFLPSEKRGAGEFVHSFARQGEKTVQRRRFDAASQPKQINN